ncbi:MAG TPA: hypothetical protein VEG62_05220, partial [Acidimicrobiales bacterium]|nr:hypothetical protein [Acidimicrobiales bacterium]
APHPSLAAGSVSVGGHDPAAGRVSLDLDTPIPVVVRNLPAGSPVPSSARLVLSLGGVAVVHSTSVPFVRQGGSLLTTLDASSGRYLVGGKMSAELELVGRGGSIDDSFAAESSRSPFGTLTGAFVIVLVLIVAAYAESLSRALRRGRRRHNRAAASGLVVVGAFAGAASALLGWLIGIDSPTVTGLVVPAALGALAGVPCGLAATAVGRRARARRQANRLVLVARRNPTPSAGSLPVGVGS